MDGRRTRRKTNQNTGILKHIDDVDKKSAFCAIFQNGYSIRAVIQFLREFVSYGNLIFTKRKLYFTEFSADQKVLIHFSINTHKLIEYRTYSPVERFKIGFSFSGLWEEITKIGKNNELLISKHIDSNDVVFKFGQDMSYMINIPICGVKENEFLDEQIEIEDDKFNFYLSLKELQQGTNILKSCRGDFYLYVYEDKIIINREDGKGNDKGGSVFKSKKNYDIDELMGISMNQIIKEVAAETIQSSIEYKHEDLIEMFTENNIIEEKVQDDEPIFKTNISPYLLKVFTKLSSLSDQGIVKFYVNKVDKALTMKVNIQDYGQLVLLIK